jgi:uracil-DNA glycosylase
MSQTDSVRDGTEALTRHQESLRACSACPDMTGPPVAGQAVLTPVMLMGQAPGAREIQEGRPFAWTAGRTLFGWFERIGLPEGDFRARVYMSAVCRCYPGKNPKSGDRVPSQAEIGNCQRWWQGEIDLVRPRLLLPVGRLAIERFIDAARLTDVVGKCFRRELAGGATVDLIPLPHPSGVSTWFKTDPGKGLLAQALSLIESHPAWRELTGGRPAESTANRTDCS